MGVICGFVCPPSIFQPFEGLVIYIVMTIMGILFLKVDILDIITHIKNPFFLLYISLINLIATPLITYYIFTAIGSEITVGLLLLASLPSGVTAAAFTDLMKGRTSLTLVIIIVTTLLSIITIPLIFGWIFHANLDINSTELGLSLLKIFAIPLVIAKVLKRVILKDLTKKLQNHYNFIIIILLALMIMISISLQSTFIIENIHLLSKDIAQLFLAFIIFQLIGYFSVFWHKKGEKLAVSNSNMIMNNILGIVLALAFFDEKVLTTVILSLIPWNIMIVAKHWYKKYLP